jgi:hypothetical protein
MLNPFWLAIYSFIDCIFWRITYILAWRQPCVNIIHTFFWHIIYSIFSLKYWIFYFLNFILNNTFLMTFEISWPHVLAQSKILSTDSPSRSGCGETHVDASGARNFYIYMLPCYLSLIYDLYWDWISPCERLRFEAHIVGPLVCRYSAHAD